jgi:hypothetical protein
VTKPRRRGPLAILGTILIASGVVAGIFIFRTQAAGEGTLPTATAIPTVSVPTATIVTPTITPTPAPTPTPTPLSSADAKQVVQAYWSDVASGQYQSAYTLLTEGSKQQQTEHAFAQQLAGLRGIIPDVGAPVVKGLRATVPVRLLQPNSTTPISVTQHLSWENGLWRINTVGG